MSALPKRASQTHDEKTKSISLEDSKYGYFKINYNSLNFGLLCFNAQMLAIGDLLIARPQGKVLATPYARAVMSMLPKTPYIPNDPIPHESINDLPVHYSTRQQIFHPVSESRHFTRRDAAKVFDSTLLPAEDRIPHPELYEMQKWKQEGMVPAERIARRRAINEEEIDRQQTAQKAREEKENTTIKRSLTPRWEFRFQDFNSEEVGKNERSAKGVGSRYGLPLQDRKKGQIKIPTKVEV